MNETNDQVFSHNRESNRRKSGPLQLADASSTSHIGLDRAIDTRKFAFALLLVLSFSA